MTPPRVLFVDHAGVLGGAELSLLDVIAAFGGSAGVVLLQDGPFRALLESRGVSVEVEPLKALGGVRKGSVLPSPAALLDAWRLAARLAWRARGFDVLYANSQKAFIVAAIAASRARIPLVWHLRDILAPPHFSRSTIRAAVWLANRKAAVVIANSRATARAFVGAGGRPALVRVVYNGIDAAPFDAVAPSTAAALRAELAPPGAFTVVHVGRFHHWKGQHVLVEAVAREPRAVAWLAGAPLFGEESYAEELKRTAERLGVAGRVRFLGFRDDIPALMRAADAVVHSSVYPEPFGRVVVEGMLAGRPVIAADAGGVSEIVAGEETGILVPPGDAAALAAAISRLIDDPASGAAMAVRARAYARNNFTVEAMQRGVLAALGSL
ncbi:MAG: glycosyltransferase [Gemmatimonadaceae bacterium]|nr:glycosyltransferase [Gemmatimonadaceae bacterium]